MDRPLQRMMTITLTDGDHGGSGGVEEDDVGVDVEKDDGDGVGGGEWGGDGVGGGGEWDGDGGGSVGTARMGSDKFTTRLDP